MCKAIRNHQNQLCLILYCSAYERKNLHMQIKLLIKDIPYQIELLSFFSWRVVLSKEESLVIDGDNMITWSFIRFVVYSVTLIASIVIVSYE